MKSKFYIVTLITLALQIMPRDGRANNALFATHPSVRTDTVDSKLPAYNKALLRKFELLTGKMDPATKNSTISGVIRIADLSASSKNEPAVSFVFCRRGTSFYYRLGTTETLNADGLYLYLDHHVHKILISAQKQVVANQQMNAFSVLAEQMRSEDYRLNSKVAGNIQTISMVNEHHISCKEYAISFDKISMDIKRIYVRLADPYTPANSKTGKIIDMRISRWDKIADLAVYLTVNKVVQRRTGGWKVTNGYKNYRLITL